MAHWWELWSPGLQAIGGVVELGGVIALAAEWFLAYSTDRNIEDAEALRLQYEALGVDLDGRDPRGSAYRQIRQKQTVARYRRFVYYYSLALIIVGVMLQVAANGIAWVAAYGLLS